jgi:hypothetical protein
MDFPLSKTDPLGTDILLDKNGDIIPALTGSVYTSSQEINVAQAVRTNVTTVPTTYLWGNGIGTELSSYVDEPLTDYDKQKIKTIVLEKVSQEKRILKVISIDLDDSNTDTLIITIEAVVSGIGSVQIPIQIGGL